MERIMKNQMFKQIMQKSPDPKEYLASILYDELAAWFPNADDLKEYNRIDVLEAILNNCPEEAGEHAHIARNIIDRFSKQNVIKTINSINNTYTGSSSESRKLCLVMCCSKRKYDIVAYGMTEDLYTGVSYFMAEVIAYYFPKFLTREELNAIRNQLLCDIEESEYYTGVQSPESQKIINTFGFKNGNLIKLLSEHPEFVDSDPHILSALNTIPWTIEESKTAFDSTYGCMYESGVVISEAGKAILPEKVFWWMCVCNDINIDQIKKMYKDIDQNEQEVEKLRFAKAKAEELAELVTDQNAMIETLNTQIVSLKKQATAAKLNAHRDEEIARLQSIINIQSDVINQFTSKEIPIDIAKNIPVFNQESRAKHIAVIPWKTAEKIVIIGGRDNQDYTPITGREEYTHVPASKMKKLSGSTPPTGDLIVVDTSYVKHSMYQLAKRIYKNIHYL